MRARKERAASAARSLIIGLVVGVFAASATGIADAQQSFTPRDEEPEEFPDVPGREETFYFCTACHNFKLVAQQGMSRMRWDNTLDFMTERHGMPKLEGKDRQVILDYLAQAFPESAPASGWQNPFLKR
jgi:hypothetical protein